MEYYWLSNNSKFTIAVVLRGQLIGGFHDGLTWERVLDFLDSWTRNGLIYEVMPDPKNERITIRFREQTEDVFTYWYMLKVE